MREIGGIRIKMLKKIVLFLLLFSLIGVTVNNPSEAGFFKKFKLIKKKQPVQEIERKEEKKILIVEIYASWCPGCKNVQPTIDQLIKEVPQIEFVQLDVSTPSKAQASLTKAKELNVSDFFNSNKSKTATVGIIIKSTGEVISIFQNNNALDDYKAAIQDAETKEKALENAPIEN